MTLKIEKYKELKQELGENVKLVAVSKIRTVEEIRLLYYLGQRDFAENYVQELIAKQMELPNDIRWHFIGHLQTNKVKYLAPFIYMIHGVDSFKLLEEINKQATLQQRTVKCLFQVHIAQEETKFGLSDTELKDLVVSLPKLKLINQLTNVKICGLMGMASFTEDTNLVRKEFKFLKCLFDDYRDEINLPGFNTLSMGMSGDYKIALEEGSNMVRIGSLLFGARSS